MAKRLTCPPPASPPDQVCLEFTARHLQAVIRTEGYTHAVAACPGLQAELLATIAQLGTGPTPAGQGPQGPPGPPGPAGQGGHGGPQLGDGGPVPHGLHGGHGHGHGHMHGHGHGHGGGGGVVVVVRGPHGAVRAGGGAGAGPVAGGGAVRMRELGVGVGVDGAVGPEDMRRVRPRRD